MSGDRAVPACHDGVCITCSDVAVEVRVTRLLPDDLAMVDTGGPAEEVSVALVTARVGDRILVHAGEAIAVLGGAGEAAAGEAPSGEALAGAGPAGEAAAGEGPGNGAAGEGGGDDARA